VKLINQLLKAFLSACENEVTIEEVPVPTAQDMLYGLELVEKTIETEAYKRSRSEEILISIIQQFCQNQANAELLIWVGQKLEESEKEFAGLLWLCKITPRP